MKKWFSLMLTLLIVLAICPLSVIATDDTVMLSVNPYGGERDDLGTVNWYKADDLGYYLFLPSDADLSSLTVYLTGSENLTVGIKTVSDGAKTDAFSRGGFFILRINGVRYSLTVMKSENLPALYLNTESDSLDYIHKSKDNKESGKINISVDGEFQLKTDALKQIKGRGNSTWNAEKKSYNIKFDKKTSVLGMESAKKWALLAVCNDNSFVRNPLSWYLAELSGLSYSSDYRVVDFYINGNYRGTYIICENVEVGENRINITDLEKQTEKVNSEELESYTAMVSDETYSDENNYMPLRKWVDIPNNPENITGGYLLELEYQDRYMDEVSGFVSQRGQCVNLKSPEYATEAEVNYISEYWQEAEDAFCSETGYNDKGRHYSEYFDMESLVNMYILEEFAADIDAGGSSCFFYKDKSGKLVASPVWDMDCALGYSGERMGNDTSNADLWLVNRITSAKEGAFPRIFNLLFTHENFRELVKKRWAELSFIYGSRDVQSFLDDFSETVKDSAIMNGIRWNGYYSAIKYEKELLTVKKYVYNRVKAFNRGFGEDGVQLFYDVNGGNGYMYDCIIYEKGDAAIVKNTEITSALYHTQVLAPDGCRFAGWNTEADGSGKTYQMGDVIILKGDTTLYAMFENEKTFKSNKLTELRNRITNAIGNDSSGRVAVQSITKLLNCVNNIFTCY